MGMQSRDMQSMRHAEACSQSTHFVDELWRGLALPGLRMSLSERRPGRSGEAVPLAVGVPEGSPVLARSMRAANCGHALTQAVL